MTKTACATHSGQPNLALKLARNSAGRVVLHVLCLVRDHKLHWHWAGICRELHHSHR
jgi:hypothetical protein